MLLFSIFPLSSPSCVLTRIFVECHSKVESTNGVLVQRKLVGKTCAANDDVWLEIGGVLNLLGEGTWHGRRTAHNGMLWKYYFILNRLVVTNNFSAPTVSWLRESFLMEISLSARVDTCHTRKRPTLQINRQRGWVSASIGRSACFICDYPGLCFRRRALLPLSIPFDRIIWCLGRRFREHITLQSIGHITIEIICLVSHHKHPRVSMAEIFSATVISSAFKKLLSYYCHFLGCPKSLKTRTQKSVFINKTIRLSAFSTRAVIIYHRSELIKIKSKSNLFAFPSNTLEWKKGNEAQCK